VIETALGEALSSTEAAAVDAAVAAAYAAAGITDDPATWNRKPPTMPDVADHLAEGSETGASLAARLAPFVTGGLSALLAGHADRPHTAEAGQLHVFDLSAVPEEMAAVTTLVVLDAIWRSLRPDGIRRLVAVDEAWLLLRDGAGAAFLSRLAKSARKRNAGLMVITQDADDLLSTSLGHTVIANAATQVLLRQAPQSIHAVAKAFALTDTEADLLASARRGDALLLAGQTRVAFSTIAAPEEHRLCLTGLEALDGERW
jgi:type IV secretory pathway VirB4 component